MVDKLGVVFCPVGSEPVLICATSAHRRRHTPVLSDTRIGRNDLEFARQLLLPGNTQKYTRAVEIGMRCIEVGATNAGVVRVDLRNNGQRSINRPSLPAALVELLHRDRESVGLGTNGDHVFCIVANHVAAGYPGRHLEYLA